MLAVLVTVIGLSAVKPYSWPELHRHAQHQAANVAAGQYPRRTPERNVDYERYKAWCKARGLTNHDYVLRYVQWRDGAAVEPALAPYELTDGIEHWILWHHPSRLPGDHPLDPKEEDALATRLLAQEGVNLPPNHIQSFQNVPSLRSIPTIAHSHVFIRRAHGDSVAVDMLAAARRRWRDRSPWLTQKP